MIGKPRARYSTAKLRRGNVVGLVRIGQPVPVPSLYGIVTTPVTREQILIFVYSTNREYVFWLTND